MEASTVPFVVFGVSIAVFILWYGSIVHSVPPKRSLSFKGRLALFLTTSRLGTFTDVAMAVFSVGSCILFVWETYLQEATSLMWMYCVELFFSVGFGFQFTVGLYTAHSIPAFLVSMPALVDIVTVIPVLISLFSGNMDVAATGGFLRFSRVMKFTRILRLLRLFRSVNVISSATDSAIRHQMIMLLTTIVSIVVMTTGFVQFMGNDVEPGQWDSTGDIIQFHDALYFTVVTFATVGYGDMSPGGWAGRLVMLTIIAATFVLVPFETSKLVRLTRLRSSYGGVYSASDGNSHIIVACDSDCSGVSDFLKEFFHEDHGAQSTRVCLLSPSEPSMAVKELLLRYKRVQYLKGDAMSGDDLNRARAEKAGACFILTNRFTPNTDEQDSITVLRALNVKSFSRELNTYVQIIQPENVVHVLSAGVQADHVLCINSVKLGLLGQSCVFPGFSTLVTNLVVSVATSDSSVRLPWQQEYSDGLMQEIYSFELPTAFHGSSFADVAWMVYKLYGATMFAVGEIDGYEEWQIKLYPGCDHLLKPGCIAFIIAEDQRAIDQIVTHAGDVKTSLMSSRHLMSGSPQARQRSGSQVVPESSVGGNGTTGTTPNLAVETGPPPNGFLAASSLQPVMPHPSGAVQPDELYKSLRRQRVSGVAQAMASPRSSDDDDDGDTKKTATPTLTNALAEMQTPSFRLPSSYNGASSPGKGAGAGAGAGAGSALQREMEMSMAAAEDTKMQEHIMGGGTGSTQMLQLRSGSGRKLEPARKAQRSEHRLRQLARATLIQNLAEVIDNMHGTVQEEFLEDLSAVLSTVALPPKDQREFQVTIKPDAESKASDTSSFVLPQVRRRRSSFIGRTLMPQPSFKRRTFLDAVRETLANKQLPGVQGVHNHVLVVAHTAEDLQYLLAPLRSSFLSKKPAVVILCPNKPSERIWSDLAAFDDVFFVEGLPHLRDLRRAGVETAEVAVMLARNTHPLSSGHFSSQDAEVVLSVLDIHSCVDHPIRSLAELNSSRYMKHLGMPLSNKPKSNEHSEENKSSDDNYIFEASYTSGKVLPANFLESLLCQAFFNRHVINLVSSMVGGCPQGQTRQERLRSNSVSIAHALEKTSFEPGMGKKCAVGSHPMQVKIPTAFTGETYGELFQFLLREYDMLPVGLYRYGTSLGNHLPFVLTSPPYETKVSHHDLAYVFAPCTLGQGFHGPHHR